MQFQDKIRSHPGVALFFYAGHGIQRHGVNYLIPVDAALGQGAETNLMRYLVDLNQVLAILQHAKVGVAIFDACRNDPYTHVLHGLLQESGLDILNVFRKVSIQVRTLTHDD